MRPGAWAVCLVWLALAFGVAVRGGLVAARAGRGAAIRARLTSPTVYLFAGYLVIAGLVSPRAIGESSSPLFGLALALPLAWAGATLASAADAERGVAGALALAALYGGSVLAAAAVVLSVASPAFVPPWLR